MKLAKADANDLQSLRAWLIKRDMDGALADAVPHIGFVASNEESKAVAIGYLRLIEGGSAMIDSLVTDPDAKSQDRNQAIDLIVRELIETARGLGLGEVLAYSVDENTLKRAERLGFIKVPHVVLTLNIQEQGE